MAILREQIEERERNFLCESATLSSESLGRERDESECSIRTCFQRDRDRLIHSKSFRRLKHKTQVFLKPQDDHYRTRLTHTLEVGQIARTIARALRLNEDLVEAIAMGHDLGHTPFGHSGEAALTEIHPGGFHHPVQSLRVVDLLERDGVGLNLTFEVRDGISKHSKGLGRLIPDDRSHLPRTLEGQIVRISDIIAYVNHDIDDAIRAGILTQDSIPPEIASVVGTGHSGRIGTMVNDVIEATQNVGMEYISMSSAVCKATENLRAFLHENVYNHPGSVQEFRKAKDLLKQLYTYYLNHIDRVPSMLTSSEWSGGDNQAVCDYIAGMTDSYAISCYEEIFLPIPWAKGVGRDVFA
ncbi:MAG: deoxyguanosinetriphosphate triphosphohydrolase [Candidatus Coatesbacteria bacterium]|nr:deoxyguanosinetriphosphate triphosphohydrolase [Candidatus Coatesbacteria bacterium]